MKVIDVLMIITVLAVLGFMVKPFLDEWDIGWENDKEKMCLPYVGNGVVAMYEYEEGCTIEQKEQRNEFAEWYCQDKFPCISKSDKEMEDIYNKWRASSP